MFNPLTIFELHSPSFYLLDSVLTCLVFWWCVVKKTL